MTWHMGASMSDACQATATNVFFPGMSNAPSPPPALAAYLTFSIFGTSATASTATASVTEKCTHVQRLAEGGALLAPRQPYIS